MIQEDKKYWSLVTFENGKIQFNEEVARATFASSKYAPFKIHLVSVIGPTGTGKSFLIAFLAEGSDHDLINGRFQSGYDRVTEGIKIFHSPMIFMDEKEVEHAVFFLDTQGTFDLQSDPEISEWITTLNLLISDIQIVNLKGNITGEDLRTIHRATEIAAAMGNQQMARNLLFMIRDAAQPNVDGAEFLNRIWSQRSNSKELEEIVNSLQRRYPQGKARCILTQMPSNELVKASGFAIMRESDMEILRRFNDVKGFIKQTVAFNDRAFQSQADHVLYWKNAIDFLMNYAPKITTTTQKDYQKRSQDLTEERRVKMEEERVQEIVEMGRKRIQDLESIEEALKFHQSGLIRETARDLIRRQNQVLREKLQKETSESTNKDGFLREMEDQLGLLQVEVANVITILSVTSEEIKPVLDDARNEFMKTVENALKFGEKIHQYKMEKLRKQKEAEELKAKEDLAAESPVVQGTKNSILDGFKRNLEELSQCYKQSGLVERKEIFMQAICFKGRNYLQEMEHEIRSLIAENYERTTQSVFKPTKEELFKSMPEPALTSCSPNVQGLKEHMKICNELMRGYDKNIDEAQDYFQDQAFRFELSCLEQNGSFFLVVGLIEDFNRMAELIFMEKFDKPLFQAFVLSTSEKKKISDLKKPLTTKGIRPCVEYPKVQRHFLATLDKMYKEYYGNRTFKWLKATVATIRSSFENILYSRDFREALESTLDSLILEFWLKALLIEYPKKDSVFLLELYSYLVDSIHDVPKKTSYKNQLKKRIEGGK
ncbi:unnamed protein product, partial [Mesorhabditis belari]|uniref:GB1/RHD3-type G domain-containing protein n=1 Tax=Mesorhabditis belari TaxID=2138241 RepID=A0AAF3ETB9_9BILA